MRKSGPKPVKSSLLGKAAGTSGFQGVKLTAAPKKPLATSSAFGEEASTKPDQKEWSSLTAADDNIPANKPLVIPVKQDANWMERQKAIDELTGDSTAHQHVIPQRRQRSNSSSGSEGGSDVSQDAYERVPVEEFGAAMLRGMGWAGDRPEDRGDDVKARPSLLGLGAKPPPAKDDDGLLPSGRRRIKRF